MGGFVSEVLDSFGFFLSQSLAQWKCFPYLHPEENPNKILYGSTAEIEDTAPDLFPQVSSACSQGKAGGLSQQAVCCSSASSSMDMSKGYNLPMDSLSIHVWNMLGSGVSKPRGWMCPGLADCGGRGDVWVPEPGPLGSGSSSDLCFQAGADGQGGPKEAGMRQKASLICQSRA